MIMRHAAVVLGSLLALAACKDAPSGASTKAKASATPSDDDQSDPKQEQAAVDPPAPPPPPTVDVGALLKDYGGNELHADGKYKGKTIRILGKVGEVKRDITNSIYVTVGTGAQFEMPTAQCFFDDAHSAEVSALTPGQSVKLDCTVDGLMGNVLLKDCAFPPLVALAICKKLEKAGAVDNCSSHEPDTALFGAKGSHVAGVVAHFDDVHVFDEIVKMNTAKKEMPNEYSSKKAHVEVMWKTDSPDVTNPKIKKLLDSL
ncbi:MAG: hypothetical protein NVS3B10_00080 [Polyangiales bacterium]